MKNKWFSEWLEREEYSFLSEYQDNEIWKNSKYVIVLHDIKGLRLMFPLSIGLGQICKVLIPEELAKQ